MIECYDASPSDSPHKIVNRLVAKRIYWQLNNKFLKLQGPKSKIPNAKDYGSISEILSLESRSKICPHDSRLSTFELTLTRQASSSNDARSSRVWTTEQAPCSRRYVSTSIGLTERFQPTNRWMDPASRLYGSIYGSSGLYELRTDGLYAPSDVYSSCVFSPETDQSRAFASPDRLLDWITTYNIAFKTWLWEVSALLQQRFTNSKPKNHLTR